jgi:hypothetical protein
MTATDSNVDRLDEQPPDDRSTADDPCHSCLSLCPRCGAEGGVALGFGYVCGRCGAAWQA